MVHGVGTKRIGRMCLALECAYNLLKSLSKTEHVFLTEPLQQTKLFLSVCHDRLSHNSSEFEAFSLGVLN